MHSSRIVIRSPQVCRIVRAPSSVRTMSLFSTPQYQPRFPGHGFPSISNEIAPIFRLIDDFAMSTRSFENWPLFQARPSPQFQPRFDVRELNDSYELRGELPGVESSNLQVEFTDAQTLVIRGATVTENTTVASSAQEAEPTTTAATEKIEPAPVADESDAVSTHSTSSYQKATVEDETVAETTSSTSAPSSVQPTPTDSIVSTNQHAVPEVAAKTSSAVQQSAHETKDQQPRYWISERTTGSFQRVFNFPSRINQEGVKASLRNGVLHINVPKAAKPVSRRINVE